MDRGAWWATSRRVVKSQTHRATNTSPFSTFITIVPHYTKGFPGGLVVKNPPASLRRPGFNPWVRKSLWRRKWQPTLVILPRKSHGRGPWWATVDGVTKFSHNVETKQEQQLYYTVIVIKFLCALPIHTFQPFPNPGNY